MKENLPQRKNIRLEKYDYSKEGYYFITICTKNRLEILGKIILGSVKTDPYIVLNKYGSIVKNELLNIPKHFQNVKIDEYVIMPNHIHIIIVIKNENVGAGLDQPVSIANIIGLYKSGVTRNLNQYNGTIWQRNYYEHIIRNEKEYYIIKQYIQSNIQNWNKDRYFN